VKNPLKYKLVLVKWVDSYGCTSQWNAIPDKDPVSHYCYSVGWIARENKETLVILPHISPENKAIDSEEHGCGEMAIPMRAVIKITKLI